MKTFFIALTELDVIDKIVFVVPLAIEIYDVLLVILLWWKRRLWEILNMMFLLVTTSGVFAVNMINYGIEKLLSWGWSFSLGLTGLPAIIMAVKGLLLPETPNSLIEQGSKEKGRRILDKINWRIQCLVSIGAAIYSISMVVWIRLVDKVGRRVLLISLGIQMIIFRYNIFTKNIHFSLFFNHIRIFFFKMMSRW